MCYFIDTSLLDVVGGCLSLGVLQIEFFLIFCDRGLILPVSCNVLTLVVDTELRECQKSAKRKVRQKKAYLDTLCIKWSLYTRQYVAQK